MTPMTITASFVVHGDDAIDLANKAVHLADGFTDGRSYEVTLFSAEPAVESNSDSVVYWRGEVTIEVVV